MKIGIIGYKRHAEKHIKLAHNLYGKSNVIIYHPYKKNSVITTNQFKKLLSCNCIVISSPTNTHLKYIKELSKNNYTKDIYLEKPGFSTIEESYELEELQSKNNLKITIGYHYPYEEKIKRIYEILNEKNIGEIISIDINISKGISYSKWFRNDWRNKDRFSISHTVLSHAISIYCFLINSNLQEIIETKIFFNNETKSFDTAIATSTTKKPLFKAIASWGSPFIDDKIDIVTTNSLISLNGDLLIVKSPRDTFDNYGLYTTPKITISEKITTQDIKTSMLNFYSRCEGSMPYDYFLFKRNIVIGRLCIASKIIFN